jgi:hypothetical protein
MLCACSSSKSSSPADPGDGGDPPDPRAACLDRPSDLPQPPSGTLPCELYPPE